MKKSILSFFLFLTTVVSALAQVTGDGYYRIQNYGTDAYCCVINNKCVVNKSNGTSQNFDAVSLWTEQKKPGISVSDPAAVIYISNPNSPTACNITSQGASVRDMFSDAVMRLTGSQDSYVLNVTMNVGGITGSADLYCSASCISDGKYYTTSASSGCPIDNKYWSIYPVNSDDNDNYFGVQPTLTVTKDGVTKYYQPYYIAFPFRVKSSGMKVFYVSSFDNSTYELKEITGNVPASTPVLIECSSQNPSDNRLELLAPGTGTDISGNKLAGNYFYNIYQDLSTYPSSLTEFLPGTMRRWAVVDGKLVLTNSTEGLYKRTQRREDHFYISASNQSFLTLVPATANAVLTSVDDKPKYTVTFDTDGGTPAVSPVTGISGTIVNAPATNPTKTGYTFQGWDTTFPVTLAEQNVTVKAQWKINQYTITFDTDGGSAVSPIKQDYNSTVQAPQNPTKTGYTFAGWDKQIPEFMPSDDVTIKAKWAVNQYTITFDTDGGSAISPIKQDYNTTIQAPQNPTKTGYSFTGWDQNIPEKMPADNVTIKAQWKINTYTITFDTDGGSAISPITQDYNTTITPPTHPTKTGYTFTGWDQNIPEKMPAGNVTIKAQWQINQYTVTFDTDGGSEISPITQNYNSTIQAPQNPTKTGYTFTGWDQNIPEKMPSGNMTIKALWQINQYNVLFLMDDGTTQLQSSRQNYGSTIVPPANPTKTGADFTGWSPTVDAVVPDHDVTYRATFSDNDFTITFDTDGGNTIEPIVARYGQTITAPENPVKLYYDFIGWDKEIPTTMPAENRTITAKWQKQNGKTIELSEGWNWVSFNLELNQSETLVSILANGKWNSGDEVKDAQHVAAYSKNYDKWIGSMTREGQFSNTAMYKVRSSQDQSLTINGNVLIPSETIIPVKPSWNYISFLPIMDMSVTEALSGYKASEGDIIKSQDAMATYSEKDQAWLGELETLSAGKGYMLYRAASDAVRFSFPDSPREPVAEAKAAPKPFLYSQNMNLIGTVQGTLTHEGDLVVAYVKGEQRGAAKVDSDNRLFLTIQGDDREDVTLALVRDGETVAMAKTAIGFDGDAIIGNLNNPTAIDFAEGDSNEAALLGDILSVTTLDGILLDTTNLNSLPSGVYLVKTICNGKTNVTKLKK